MKIQELAIIFVIIILPISILLSEYTQFQIQTIKTQTEYDAKLTAATYDAIKAFQLNTYNSSHSDLANSQMRDLEASINSFMNSIKSTFGLNGYNEDALNNYIPALVYTLYDGFYIYSPYENTNYRYLDEETGESITKLETEGNETKADENGEKLYGLKPYINYSCRYKTEGIDVVITYALDNYITVRGTIRGEYVNKSGYLVDGINYQNGKVTYNGIGISQEYLSEYLPIFSKETGTIPAAYPYAKINGTKYYMVDLKEDVSVYDDTPYDSIIYISNGKMMVQCQYSNTPEGEEPNQETKDFLSYMELISNNNQAILYYKEAAEFTKWLKEESGLRNLEYCNAVNEKGETIWQENETKIFLDESNNIENETSNFNQHRLAVIRHKIETNLAIAISNYNEYFGVNDVFRMPDLKEDEWYHIIHNISLISFLQGMPIGGKTYNGYSIVTNSESEEVVIENNIYILGADSNYHKIGDTYLEKESSVNAKGYGPTSSAGRINLDFERKAMTNAEKSVFYYPLKAVDASYESVVMQNNVKTYDDIYKYVNTQPNNDLKLAFYTALGRERASRFNSQEVFDTNKLSGEKYVVNYHADGATNVPLPQIKAEGIDLTLSEQKPTRTGYSFKGWSTVENGPIVYSGGEIYIDDSNLDLYAVWERVYTITYQLVGGYGGVQPRQRKGVGETIIISRGPTIPRPGCTFIGWSTTRDSSVEYNPGDLYSEDADLTLYAVWSNEPMYLAIGSYVKYSARDYTGGWRILYNNNGQLDLVSERSVASFELNGISGYLNAVSRLNSFANNYRTGFATSARCISPNDVEQLRTYNMIQRDGVVWLASTDTSRNGSGNYEYVRELVKTLKSDGSIGASTLRMKIYRNNIMSNSQNYSVTQGFRPVIKLQSGLKVIGGTGTSTDPYVLSR